MSTTPADALVTRAATHAGTVAVAVAGGPSLTYLEWEQRSAVAADGLEERGVGRGDHVLLRFDLVHWTEYAVAHLAVLRAGGVAVPVPAWLPDPAVGRVATATGAVGTVVARRPASPRGGSWVAGLVELEAGGGPPRPRPSPVAEDAAEVRCTVPLLGPPAVTRWSHAQLAGGPTAAVPPGGPPPRSLLHACPVGSDLAQVALCLPLGPDAAVAIACAEPGPGRVFALASELAVEALGVSPLAAELAARAGAPRRGDRSHLRYLFVSGRAPAAALSRLARAVAASVVSVNPLPAAGTAAIDAVVHERRRPGAVGLVPRPRVLGAGDERLGAGEAGWVDGAGALYMPDPGDRVARWRGAALLASEVEGVATDEAGVADAAVVSLPDAHGGERLVLAVAPSPGREASGLELLRLVEARLGPEKAPSEVVVLDQLPRNRHGVLLGRRLRQRLGAPPPAPPRRAAPEAEDAVAAVWRRVLGRADVAWDDELFELGAGEADAARALALVEDALGVRVALRDLVHCPTVAGVASVAESLRGRAGEGAADPPVAFSQEGMLWHEQLSPGCQNLPALARRYRGPLDVAALERALGEIVRRHEPLRTAFEVRRGRAVQVVGPPGPLHLPVRDLTSLTPADQDAEVERTLAEEGARPFDLATAPLFSPTLLRLGPEDHVVVLRVHHSVYDDWSVGVFRRELSSHYAAFAAGQPSPLPEPPVRFGEFSRRQRRRLAGPAGAAELAYWRDELAGAPLTTQLPIGDPDLPEGTPPPAPEPVSMALPAPLHAALRELARRERATLFMTVLAAFQVLVHRYTGRDDLLLASVVANRNRTELEGLVGCFTKKVPLRLRLAPGASFSDVVAGARSSLLGALSHQDLAFETVLQDTLGAAGADHGLVPHVAVMVQGVAPPADEPVLPGLTTAGLGTGASTRRAHFMAAGEGEAAGGPAPAPWGAGVYGGGFLILSVVETPGELSFHARGAFHPPAVRRLMAGFRTVLEAVVEDPGAAAAEVDVLGEGGRAELDRWNGATGDLPAPLTLTEAFAAHVDARPSAVAVVDGAVELTYAELDRRADALADRLRRAGVGRGARVGVGLPPSAGLAVAVLAVWRSGAAVAATGARPGGGDAGAAPGEGPVVVVAGAGGEPVVVAPAVAVNAGSTGHPGPGDAAVVVGTGAEAVALSHAGVLNVLAGLRDRVLPRRRDRREPLGVCLSAGPAGEAFLHQVVALLDGRPLHVAPPPWPDPAPVVALLARDAVDAVACSAAELAALVGGGLAGTLAARGPEAPPVAVWAVTGGAVDPELWRAAQRVPGAAVHLVHGPARCGYAALHCPPPPPGSAAARPAGRPMPGVRTVVRDRLGQPLPVLAAGELHVDGQAVPGAVATGQRARYLPDGRVELLGPLDGWVDLRGFDVDRGTIEAVLAAAPGVADAAVVLGDGPRGRRLVAYVTPVPAAAPSLPALRTRLWARLPGYAWPAELVVVDAIPRHETGEVDADRLPPAGGWAAGAADAPGGTPSTAEEEALATAWARTLGVSRLSPAENYWQDFSFLEALGRLREAGIDVGTDQVARNRTLRTLAVDMAARRASHRAGGG